MSSRFDAQFQRVVEDQAHADARLHFAEPLKRFAAYRDAVERLERNLSIVAMAASVSASSSASKDSIIHTDNGTQWHKDVDLLENIHLCHRMVSDEPEFAAVEHFPANNTNEIWNRGNIAIEVVRAFAQEQRQALQVWTEDMAAQLKEFLATKYPTLDRERIADFFLHGFTQTVSSQNIPLHVQNFNQGCSDFT